MKESLVAINIIKNGYELLNPSSVPILLYWNDKENKTIQEEIFNNKTSYDYIINKCCNIENYTYSGLSFFYFKDVNDDAIEDYIEYSIDIQTLFNLSSLHDEDNIFYKDYINKIFNYLYNCSYKEDYNISSNPLLWEDNIIDIYKKIQHKYPNKISKNTVINYIRSELLQTYNLNTDNTNWIINKVINILGNEV